LKNLTSFKGQPQTSPILYLNKYTSNIEFGLGLGSELGIGLDVRIRPRVRVTYD